ncbi:MAG: CHAT domain-containing protein [bacterium]
MPVTLDFHIERGKDGNFSLQVFERNKTHPLAREEFSYELSYTTEFQISRMDLDTKDPHERLQSINSFGSDLYKRIFTEQIKGLWNEYKGKNVFLTLCIRIAPEAKELEILPWEALNDGAEYISTGACTSLTRLPLDISPQDILPELPLPVKMLSLISSPLDLEEHERLAIEQEQEILLQATNSPSGQGRLTIEFEDEAKLPVIEGSMEGEYHILHYSGHGINPGDGGGVLLEDLEGKRRPTSVSDFLNVIEKGEKNLRLVLLSGCQTARTLNIRGFQDLARGFVRRKIPAVIAMQFSITDKAGLIFAQNLYPRLMEGQSLDAALSACRRILLQHDEEIIRADAFAPVLFLANAQPLKTTLSDVTKKTTQPKIELNYYLPLPQLSFGFYGRRKEYRTLRDSLLHRNHRAVIVHGIGGIGKTALISHAAERLRSYFKGVYAFDCRSGTLAPDTILLELHRFLELQGIKSLEGLIHLSLPPEQLASYVSQVLSEWPLLIIFDNFEEQLKEEQLKEKDGSHHIADDNLRAFLMTLIKTTAKGSRFLFTTRYLFDIDEKRIGTINHIPLHDLSRPEALGLMQKLPHLAQADYPDKLRAYKTFGGHPYALVTLDRHCSQKSLTQALDDAEAIHTELREFLAIELNYSKLSQQSCELLNRLAAFRRPIDQSAAHWVIGKKVKLDEDRLKKMAERLPDEFKKLPDAELLQLLEKLLPEERHAEGIDQPITELVN